MPGQGKKYYRIGEVSRMTGVEPHVLRYWESEFSQIRPRRVARQRLFRQKDVELVARIRDLLHKEGFTISGAKKQIARERRAGVESLPGSHVHGSRELLDRVKKELVEIVRMLDHSL